MHLQSAVAHIFKCVIKKEACFVANHMQNWNFSQMTRVPLLASDFVVCIITDAYHPCGVKTSSRTLDVKTILLEWFTSMKCNERFNELQWIVERAAVKQTDIGTVSMATLRTLLKNLMGQSACGFFKRWYVSLNGGYAWAGWRNM
jgi:hypothetical protein